MSSLPSQLHWDGHQRDHVCHFSAHSTAKQAATRRRAARRTIEPRLTTTGTLLSGTFARDRTAGPAFDLEVHRGAWRGGYNQHVLDPSIARNWSKYHPNARSGSLLKIDTPSTQQGVCAFLRESERTWVGENVRVRGPLDRISFMKLTHAVQRGRPVQNSRTSESRPAATPAAGRIVDHPRG